MTQYFFETDGGETGYIEASSIEEARAKFRADHPEIDPQCAGVWAPEDPEYPQEWQYDAQGQPCCTAFIPEDQPIPVRCTNTPDMFA